MNRPIKSALALASVSLLITIPSLSRSQSRGWGRQSRYYAPTVRFIARGPVYRAGVLIGTYGRSAVVFGYGAPCAIPWYYGYGVGGYVDASQGYAAAAFGIAQGRQFAGVFGAQQYSPPVTARPAAPPRQESPPPTESGGYGQTGGPGVSRWAGGRPAGNDADSYYLNRPARRPQPTGPLSGEPGLASAVQDICDAFRTGDSSLLERHVDPTDTITLQATGRTRKPLTGSAYIEMTREAFKSVTTVWYDLDQIAPASNGAWMVYGTHVLRGEDGVERTFTVAFVLKKRDSSWLIAEFSADPA